MLSLGRDACHDGAMAGAREQSRARTTAAIVAAARAEIAAKGGGGLSMRSVAREVGMVSSAVYRYFPTREALLTAMILESYAHLASALGRVKAADPARTWTGLARAMRRWALAHPHEFQLIYGTPVPGYVAPLETIPAAEAVARPFLAVGATREVAPFDDARLARQMTGLAGGEVTPSGAAAVLAELAALVGLVSLELAGHLVGTADPADRLFEAIVARQVATLGLD